MTSDEFSNECGEKDFPSYRSSPPQALSEDSDDADLQRTWLSAQAFEWRSLALVPASDGVSVVQVAEAFAAVGFRNCGESIGVADLRDVSLPQLRGPIEVVRWHTRRGERVIMAVRPCFRSHATVPLVRAADCAVLCVALGVTRIAEANETVARIGRDYFIGTLLVQARENAPDDSLPYRVPRLGFFS